jgi:hypothetical protein
MWLTRSVTRPARCGDTNNVSRRAAWLRWGVPVATRRDLPGWRQPGANASRISKLKVARTMRSRGSWALVCQPFAKPCGAWDGKSQHRGRPNSFWERLTQRLPTHRRLNLFPPQVLRPQGRTQTCPLFVLRAKPIPRPARIPIRLTAGWTDCWRGWACWRMRRRCLVLPRRFHGREFCWPCPPWSPAACSSARKRSMAASARPSMDCAPVCSRSC